MVSEYPNGVETVVTTTTHIYYGDMNMKKSDIKALRQKCEGDPMGELADEHFMAPGSLGCFNDIGYMQSYDYMCSRAGRVVESSHVGYGCAGDHLDQMTIDHSACVEETDDGFTY